MKSKFNSFHRLMPLIFTISMTSLHATVNSVGVDSTTGPNWRTGAALDADSQYGTLGYVVFGINAGEGQYISNFNIASSNTQNAYSLPSGIAITPSSTGNYMWSGNGNFGQMQDPGNGNALTSTPVINVSPRSFTITRATSTGYRITLLTASGDGANATYTVNMNDGTGAVTSSYAHTANGLAYHVFQVSPGTSNIAINVTSPATFSLTGIAFDAEIPFVPITWVGGSTAWDGTTSGNWKVTADNSPTLFSSVWSATASANSVVFDDSGTNTTVDIGTGNVTPASVLFNNTTKDYILQGSNAVAGSTGLTKSGDATLTVLNSNTYTGGTTIDAGTLTLGGAAQLGGGTYAGFVSNSGSLICGSSANQVFSGAISGTGSLSKSGSGTLTLSSTTSAFTGNIDISGGTLLATGSANGSSPVVGSVGNLSVARTFTVDSGGTLSFGNNNVLGDHIGAGNVALVINAGGTVTNNGAFFTALGAVTLNGGTLTAIGGANATFPSYGLKGTVTAGGGTTSTISTSGPNSGISLGEDTVSAVTFDVGTDSTLNVAAPLGNGQNHNYTAALSSTLTKTGDGTLTLGGTCSYSGTTTVNGGTLAVNGSVSTSGSAITVNSTGTLAGTGTINRPVTVAGGATLAPAGSAIGTLTTSKDFTFVAGAKASCQIDKTTGVLTQDLLEAGSSGTVMTFAGTLEIIATGDALAAGDSFKLFNAGTYQGAFSSYIKPTLPAGLSWDLSGLIVDGTVAVVDTAPAPIFNPSPGGYVGAQSVTISSDPGTTIHYTTNGTDPHTSGTTITVASPAIGIVIPTDTESMTLTAYASQSGKGDSATVSATYSTVTTPTWSVDADGDWSNAANWLHSVVPDGIDVTADFSLFPQTALSTVMLNSNRSVGTLKFGNSNPYDWVLSSTGGSLLTLAASTGSPVIDVVNQSATISAAMTGTQGFTKSGNGRLVLSSASSDYTGDIMIAGGTVLATVQAGVNDPTTGSLGNPAATRAITVNSGGTLSFGANDILGNHISTIGVATLVHAGGTITNNGNFFNTLGAVTLDGGTIHVIGGANANFPSFAFKGPITATTGTTSIISGTGTNAAFQLGAAAVIGTTFDVQGSGTLNISGNLNNSRSVPPGYTAQASPLTKSGNGILVLGGTNTYTGTTSVNSGTLELNGSLTSATTVKSAAILKGSGTTTGTLSVESGGTVAPGNSIGILHAGATTVAGNYVCEVNATDSDLLAVTGALDLTGSIFTLSGVPAAASYTIATYTGALTGTFTASPALPSGYSLDYATAGVIKLVSNAGFSSWIAKAEWGLAPADQDPGDDPDGDGVNNLMEYAIAGRNPGISDGSVGGFDGSLLSFTKRAEAAADANISYTIQESDDLDLTDPWAEVGSYTSNSATTISYTLPPGGSKKFARLVVTQSP